MKEELKMQYRTIIKNKDFDLTDAMEIHNVIRNGTPEDVQKIADLLLSELTDCKGQMKASASFIDNLANNIKDHVSRNL